MAHGFIFIYGEMNVVLVLQGGDANIINTFSRKSCAVNPESLLVATEKLQLSGVVDLLTHI